jgi:hypothetical protein
MTDWTIHWVAGPQVTQRMDSETATFRIAPGLSAMMSRANPAARS